IRAGDEAVQRAVARITDEAAAAALDAERGVVMTLGGGCQTPIGALGTPLDRDRLEVVGVVVALDGSRAVRANALGPLREAAAIGARVGRQLLADGAGDILADAQRAQGAVEGIQP